MFGVFLESWLWNFIVLIATLFNNNSNPTIVFGTLKSVSWSNFPLNFKAFFFFNIVSKQFFFFKWRVLILGNRASRHEEKKTVLWKDSFFLREEEALRDGEELQWRVSAGDKGEGAEPLRWEHKQNQEPPEEIHRQQSRTWWQGMKERGRLSIVGIRGEQAGGSRGKPAWRLGMWTSSDWTYWV